MRFCLFLLLFLLAPVWASDALVIAHRGASAYLPEHTLPAYALAYGQGADYLEPDLVLTADGVLIALHDKTLDATTNVAEVFPDRAREDGGFYAIDFTLEEIRQLNARERVEADSMKARYSERWPVDLGRFEVVTFDELIELTRELNRSTGRRVGVYPELKFPAFHAEHGQDIATVLIETLLRHDLPSETLPVFVQSFEPEPLQRIHEQHGDRFALIQLIGENDWDMNTVDYDAMRSQEGLQSVAEYAVGIGPPLLRLIEGADGQPSMAPSEFMNRARDLGLKIHPYTFRREGLPAGVTLEGLLQLFIGPLGIDGVFTDNPDVALKIREAQSE